MIIANMTWNPKPEKGGADMPIRLAQILYKLGFAVTYDADQNKIRIYRNK